MGNSFLGSCRVRPFEGVAPTEGALRVGSLLGLEVVRDRVAGFDAALTVALWHESYLYEHGPDAPGLTPGVLRALEALGDAWVSRELATVLAQGRHDEKPGTISRTVADSRVAFAQHVAEHEDWVAACGQYGASITGGQPPRVRNRVFHQVVGLLCLVGAETSLRSHVGATLTAVVVDAATTDWVTPLEKAAAMNRLRVDWSFTASGRDHDRTFVATCTAGARRRVSAAGASKKAARAAAAERMLREHFPQVIHELSRSTAPPRPPLFVPRADHPDFARTVDEIAGAFGLPESATPLIAQAFVHSSWAYEHRREIVRARQRDHGVLGFVGSQVLDFEASLAETSQVVRAATDEYAHRTFERRTHVEAMHLLGLDRAILLGRGQRLIEVSDELSSTVFQALMAAVHLARGAPASLFERWPDGAAWGAVAELIAPGASPDTDVSTRVQEFAAACGLITNYEFDRAGPDHRAEYTARLVLDSPPMRRRVRVKGSPQASKTAAKHGASAIVVGWIDALADADELDLIANRDGPALAGTTFLLAHLCEVASQRTILTVPWRRRGLLGSALGGRELERWAAAADRLLLRQQRVQPDVDGLAAYFRKTFGSADRALPLSDALASTLRWIVAIDPQDPIDEREQRRLVDLAAAYRALGGDQQAVSLAEAIEGQVLLSRGLLTSDVGSGAGTVPALAVAAIEALLAVMLADRRRVRIVVSESDEIVLRPGDSAGRSASELGPTVAVWRELGISLDLDEVTGAVTLHLDASVDAGAGPVAAAVLCASSPQPSPLAGAVANLLHDLKNQVAAAKVLAAAPDDGSRTARLERQLAASRHLDQAAVLAERIRAASSLLRPGGAEATPLSTFLRRYASAVIVRIPASVSLVIGSGADDLAVAMSEAGLTAVLDNLIKNAVEAMSDGGRVTLDWTYVDDVAVIEVTDDGPGLSDSVHMAFASGGRIGSTKPGGNGLGLLGVRSLLRRVGGDFELARSTTGTVCHLTIPLADEAAS